MRSRTRRPKAAKANSRPAVEPLADAIRRALADESDPAIRGWLQRLLDGDAKEAAGPTAAAPPVKCHAAATQA